MSTFNLVSFAIAKTLDTKGEGYFTRPAGSSVLGLDVSDGQAVMAFLSAHSWTEVTGEAVLTGAAFGSCRYFRAEIAEGYFGQEGIATLGELSDADLAAVRIVRGHHGDLELQLPGQAPRLTRIIHMILGSYESFPEGPVTTETAGVVTWYPGRLTAPVGIDKATVKFIAPVQPPGYGVNGGPKPPARG
jgi:hypothetical protein